MNHLRFFSVALLAVAGLCAQDSRLSGISARAHSGTGATALTTGFVIGPGSDQTLLIRAIGPTLDVAGAMADPVLTLFNSSFAVVATNDNWLTRDATAFSTAGASPLPTGSSDAAIVTTLAPGSYTAQVNASDDTAGLAQIEIFALGSGASLLNTSTRFSVGPGTAPAMGLVVSPGTHTRRLLIRASGPALAPFGLTGILADPTLRVTRANETTTLATNDHWSSPADSRAASTQQLQDAFTQAGAFVFPAPSKDSALLLDLAPGHYSIHVGSVDDAPGLTLVEVYDLTATALSVTTTSEAAESRTRPTIAAAAPVGHSADSDQNFRFSLSELTRVIELYNVRIGTTRTGRYRVLAGTEDGFAPDPLTADGTAVVLAAYHTADSNKDGKLSLAELTRVIELYNYRSGTVRTGGYHVRAGSEDGYAPSPLMVVSIAATIPAADESGSKPGEFTVTRVGDLAENLTVNYGVGGSAINGFDYPALLGTVVIPAGSASVKIPLTPNPDVQVDALDTVVITITSGTYYEIDTPNTATVTIADSPSTLYVATVRPYSTAPASTASGTATILLSSSGTVAAVNVSFSSLSSAQVTAHLTIGASEDYVLNLPQGQVTGTRWAFAPTGPYTSAALLDALKTGNIAVRIDTANYPAGEVKGVFIQGTGSAVFTAPAAAPAVVLTKPTATDAARLLTQATFGPTKAEIDSLTGASIDTWITAQLALPFTSHRTAIQSDRTTYGGSSSFTNWNATHGPNRQSAWFKTSLTAPDQLRQRVAFALSQILVISDVALGDDSDAEPLAYYYDQLGNGAFGNFRTLLETVTLSPMMGRYLSSLRNSKADPVTGTTPDENYAREVMQLFTIGLSQLQPDGTLVLGADGLPTSSYNQKTITEMAKVFTGWSYPGNAATQFRTAGRNSISPMQIFPLYHDDTVKDISPVTATLIPASQGGTQDLKLALDALFNHQNTAPFIAKLLIQRLVTSNPSPAYVYRVAQKFVNNGSGVRGDLAAVVRAILIDYEARSPVIASNITFGKLKEPLLRLTGLLRTFGASSTSGRFLGYHHTVDLVPITSATPLPALASQINQSPNTFSVTRLDGVQGNLAEAAMRSPTVFNFYHPDYVLPGPLAAAGMVAPEFEITDDNFAISTPNFLRTFVNAAIPTSGGVPTPAAPYVIMLNLTYEQTLLSTPTALLDHLNVVLCSGSLSAASRTRIITALAALPTATTTIDRAKVAILMVLTSPAAAIQK